MTVQQGQNPLAGLRDIHMPTDMPPVWPPAIGWWLLPLVVLLLVFLVRFAVQMRRRSLRKNALNELASLQEKSAKLSATELAQQTSELLKRVAISRYGRNHVAKLHGIEWINYLKANSKTPEMFTAEISDFVINAPYRNSEDAASPDKATTLCELCNQWIRQNT